MINVRNTEEQNESGEEQLAAGLAESGEERPTEGLAESREERLAAAKQEIAARQAAIAKKLTESGEERLAAARQAAAAKQEAAAKQAATRQLAARQPSGMKPQKKSPKKLLFLVLAFIIVVTVTLIVWHGYQAELAGVSSPPSNTQQNPQTTPGPLGPDAKNPQNQSNIPGRAVRLAVESIEDTRELELVNSTYGVDVELEEWQLVTVAPTAPVSNWSIKLRSITRDAVAAAITDARAAGLTTLYVNSGYRDYLEQERLYNNTWDKSTVQIPGYSEHQTGYAIDISATGADLYTATTAAWNWLADHSWEYGLIARYPQDKQEITGVVSEPWHFRYIGLPHAWYCYHNKLCFEEYIQFLKDTGGYSTFLNGVQYTVSYQYPVSGNIYVPLTMEYTVSGDNTGGYIVTMWE